MPQKENKSRAALALRDAQIMELYRAGATKEQLATVTGLTSNRIGVILRRGGVDLGEPAREAIAAAQAGFGEFIKSRQAKVQEIINQGLDLLPDKLVDSSAVQIGTLIGILFDKWTAPALRGGGSAEIEDLTPLADLINEPVRAEEPAPGDDPTKGGGDA